MPIYYCLHNEVKRYRGVELLNAIAEIYGANALVDLLLFDALIYNTDRHLGNFGMIIDNSTNKLLRPAPIFDNGFSIFNHLTKDELNDIPQATNRLDSYFDMSFDTQMRYYTQERHLENLDKLSRFEFTKHPEFNLPDSWLEPINKHIKERAKYAIRLYENRMSIQKSSE